MKLQTPAGTTLVQLPSGILPIDAMGCVQTDDPEAIATLQTLGFLAVVEFPLTPQAPEPQPETTPEPEADAQVNL